MNYVNNLIKWHVPVVWLSQDKDKKKSVKKQTSYLKNVSIKCTWIEENIWINWVICILVVLYQLHLHPKTIRVRMIEVGNWGMFALILLCVISLWQCIIIIKGQRKQKWSDPISPTMAQTIRFTSSWRCACGHQSCPTLFTDIHTNSRLCHKMTNWRRWLDSSKNRHFRWETW